MIDKVVKTSVYSDMLNTIGLLSYSHIDERTFENECKYNNLLEQIVEESICELDRFHGGFEIVFPRKSNIDRFGKLFINPGEKNLALWEQIKERDIF